MEGGQECVDIDVRQFLGLVGLVDVSLTLISPETERATSHVLDQTLDTGLIARWQKHRLVDAEATDHRCATVPVPSPHVLDDFWFDLLLGQIQREDRFLPSDQESLHIELGQLQKISLGCKRSASDQHVDVRQERFFLAQIITDSCFSGRIRSDHRGNAFFRHCNRDGICGYEIKGPNGFTRFTSGREKGRFDHSCLVAGQPRSAWRFALYGEGWKIAGTVDDAKHNNAIINRPVKNEEVRKSFYLHAAKFIDVLIVDRRS